MIEVLEIPKIAHFVWIGSAPFPASAVETTDRFFEMHPGWETQIWTNDKILQLAEEHSVIKAAWDAYPESVSMRSMIAKLSVMLVYGGCAPDVDIYMMRSLDSLLEKRKDNFFATEQRGVVSSCFFAATPKHRLIRMALEIAADHPVKNPNQLLYEVRDTWPRPRFNVVPDHYFCPIRVRSEVMEFLRKWPADQVIDLEKRKKRYTDQEMPFGVHAWGSGYPIPKPFGFAYPNEATNYPEELYEIKELTEEEALIVKEHGIDAIKDDGKRAGFFRKLVNVASATGRVIKAVVKKEKLAADPELVKARYNICKTSGDGGGPCHYLNGISCTKCGCVLAFKQRLATESCPIGRW